MKYSELSEQEKRIWDYVYAKTYLAYGSGYIAVDKANSAIYALQNETKRSK